MNKIIRIINIAWDKNKIKLFVKLHDWFYLIKVLSFKWLFEFFFFFFFFWRRPFLSWAFYIELIFLKTLHFSSIPFSVRCKYLNKCVSVNLAIILEHRFNSEGILEKFKWLVLRFCFCLLSEGRNRSLLSFQKAFNS